jgi:glycosyltransferase involved in cell wall biosynthesis
MPDVVFAIPGDIDQPTGGYAYDRRVLGLLPTLGIKAHRLMLPGSFPEPSAADIAEAERLLKAAPDYATLLVDGLAYGALPAAMLRRLRRRIIALVHHPLYLEAGLSEARKKALQASEKAALAVAQHVIVTSRSTARIVAKEMGVAADHISVAEPGTDPAPRASGTGMPMQLLAVGAISPRKGYDVLIVALGPRTHIDWRLTIAGPIDRDPAAAAALKVQIADAGLSERVLLKGAVMPGTLDVLYENADVFVMPSLFEGYGMVLAEAMARGLAIVCTTGGAAAETVPDKAAIKVAPGDAAALGAAIETVMTNRKVRSQMREASWRAGRLLPTWHETTRRIAAVIMGLKA